MNVYFVDAGMCDYTAYSEDGYSAIEGGDFADFVVAETRGQAHAYALDQWKDMFSVRLEWIDPISIKKVGTYDGCKSLIYPYYERLAVNWTIPNPPKHYEDEDYAALDESEATDDSK